MRRICTLTFILIMLSVAVGLAQSAGGQKSSPQPSCTQHVYDRFDEKWLNPGKWQPAIPGCQGALECVREIQNGQLRLAVRNLGATDSDSGSQFSESEVWFVNPNAISSITADVTLRRFRGIGCSANNTDTTKTVVKISGSFFNTGSGDAADDVSDDLYLSVDTSNPKTMLVANWLTGSGLGVGTDIGYYPIGTPLTVSNAWDKANHRFISVVKVTGESGPGKTVVVPYTVSDTTPPVYPYKYLPAMVFSSNCTSAQTFAQVEAFYDNVMTNVAPRSAE